jgi:hypothetical protein
MIVIVFIGLFCVHVLRAFMHLQIERIPKEYILQRYTYSARQDVAKKAMKVVHHASLSNAGNDRALAVMDELLKVLSRLETDIEV